MTYCMGDMWSCSQIGIEIFVLLRVKLDVGLRGCLGELGHGYSS